MWERLVGVSKQVEITQPHGWGTAADIWDESISWDATGAGNVLTGTITTEVGNLTRLTVWPSQSSLHTTLHPRSDDSPLAPQPIVPRLPVVRIREVRSRRNNPRAVVVVPFLPLRFPAPRRSESSVGCLRPVWWVLPSAAPTERHGWWRTCTWVENVFVPHYRP